jgi:predicted Zn-dependent peptidase
VYDKQGAYVNAHTEKRYTCYIIKCSDAHFKPSIQVLADMMTKSLFDKREYAKEKHVVMEETILLNDQPNAILFDMIDRLVYRGSSYEHPIDIIDYHTGVSAGTARSESNVLDYKAIVEMYRAYYVPDKMILSVVTQIPMQTVLAHLRQTGFVRSSRDNANTPCRTHLPKYSLVPQDDIRCRVLYKKGVQATYFGIGFRTCSLTHPDKYALNILKYILGGYMSSRLFQLLRNNRGLTYSSKVHTDYYEHAGIFFIYVSVDPRKIIHHTGSGKGGGVIPIIIHMLNDLVKHGVSAKELETAKGFIQGNQLLSAENGDNMCFYNGLEYLLCDRPDEIVPFIEVYDTHYHGITRDDIRLVVRQYFRLKNMNVVCVGGHTPGESAILRECARFCG